MATSTSHRVAGTSRPLATLPLWAPQREAVEHMRRYLAAYHDGQTEKAGLVHMPTGSGKTGVIAVLARLLPEVRCAIVLTPRVALRQQLRRDLESRFFERLTPRVDPAGLPKNVVDVDKNGQILKVKDLDSTVFVLTIQMIDRLADLGGPEWDALQEHVSLVIVDEGHCEPASSWSQAVRSFDTPKIIFTATPFRNDLKVFDIDISHIYSYTFHTAVRDHVLRDVAFIRMEHTKDPDRFIDTVLAFYSQELAKRRGPAARVIIRCDRRDEIRQIETALKKRDQPFVAIHETFPVADEKRHEYRQVPDPAQLDGDPIFWIHQFKLQEGIDDPRFQVLASFEAQHDGRGLVQQIGRIIRNPSHDAHAKGYVLDFSEGQQEELWHSYLAYDEALTSRGPAAFNLASDAGWLADLFKSQPILTYMKYRFRTPLVLDEVDPRRDLLWPRMVNLRYEENGFSMNALCDALEHGYADEDRLFHRYEQNGAVIYLYVKFDNSPLLENAYFLEPKLGMTYLRRVRAEATDGHRRYLLAYFDSSGYLPVDHAALHLGKPVASEKLRKLFSDHAKSCLTSVSLRNSNLGTIAIRSRSIRAADIGDTVSAFDDHAQICTNAIGYTLESGGKKDNRRLRRYLGFESGRISESGAACHLKEYETWLDTVVGTMKQPRNPVPAFSRYAAGGVDFIDTGPRHILLDLADEEDAFETIGEDGVPKGEALMIDDVSQPIDHGHFRLNANGKMCEVEIEFNAERRRYELSSRALDGLYSRKTDQTDKRGVIDYLNQEQSFRVIPSADDLIYTLGQFYHPLFKTGKFFDPTTFEVSQVMIPVPILASIGEEKGTPGNPNGWDTNTLFGIIDTLGAPADGVDPADYCWFDHTGQQVRLADVFGNPEILVCDDMGTEAADFIMADSRRRRVVFIHAKGDDDPHLVSASALQDVTSQATKNINFLGMYNQACPTKLGNWQNPWRKGGSQVTNRIRRGAGLPAEIWKRIHAITRNPLTDREVWLFLGKLLSKSEFEKLLAQTPPGAEALQAAYLLSATLTNVASVGAKLRIFCYP